MRLWTMLCLAAAGAAAAAPDPAAPANARANPPTNRPAASPVASPTADVPDFGELTVITSERLVYDGKKQFIELEGSVVISDPEMKMKADRVRIDLEGSNEVRQVAATGRVVISQADKHAWAGRATFTVAEGKFVLEDDPRVLRGGDMMTADRITFWQNQDRMECFPNARLILQPDPSRKGNFMKGLP